MNFNKYLIPSLLLLLSGCSAKVMTYDVAGNVIGSCKATQGFIFGAKAECYGHGNSAGVDYRQVNIKTGLLPTPPVNTQIQLNR
ncbi:hypothetical protein [Acinetobacter wuhouensis]|uniref:DUF333 domain-containing protein n=1 Tax=Acinetobacter wuhouensis TaxID=1879050 RepID=A0A3G2T4R9_9GAMM|nr:hypothetical protein [Acinetobacter wuhouensis]AYO54985.1 hypothetical protein CDG68_15575 [Acinetobacter wuhouensis]